MQEQVLVYKSGKPATIWWRPEGSPADGGHLLSSYRPPRRHSSASFLFNRGYIGKGVWGAWRPISTYNRDIAITIDIDQCVKYPVSFDGTDFSLAETITMDAMVKRYCELFHEWDKLSEHQKWLLQQKREKDLRE